MLSLFANALAGLGRVFATVGSVGCVVVYIDEPECPKSLIK